MCVHESRGRPPAGPKDPKAKDPRKGARRQKSTDADRAPAGSVSHPGPLLSNRSPLPWGREWARTDSRMIHGAETRHMLCVSCMVVSFSHLWKTTVPGLPGCEHLSQPPLMCADPDPGEWAVASTEPPPLSMCLPSGPTPTAPRPPGGLGDHRNGGPPPGRRPAPPHLGGGGRRPARGGQGSLSAPVSQNPPTDQNSNPYFFIGPKRLNKPKKKTQRAAISFNIQIEPFFSRNRATTVLRRTRANPR